MPRENCPVCDARRTECFLRRRSVPAHQNMLFTSAAAARAITRGDLEMRACPACGFVFNAAFDPTRVDYGPAYENSQDRSPAFNAHLDERVDHLVRARGVRCGRVVEVGCGKGVFLRKLLAHPLNNSDAVGFDPAFTGAPEPANERIRFVTDFYGPETAVPADAVVCRHVIEHVPEPLDLLRTVRAGVGRSGSTRVFFETPCVEWILRGRVMWDFFYEHCSIFTTHSLALALSRAGFEPTGVEHVFGGQYLWAEGTSATSGSTVSGDGAEIAELAAAFGDAEREQIASWQALIAELGAHGPLYAWGAGAKGVTFCNLADTDATRLAGVVDVNPAKQGKYLPGTGHAIVAPQSAIAAHAVFVFNPNYVTEVADILNRLGSDAAVIDLSRLEESHAAGH